MGDIFSSKSVDIFAQYSNNTEDLIKNLKSMVSEEEIEPLTKIIEDNRGSLFLKRLAGNIEELLSIISLKTISKDDSNIILSSIAFLMSSIINEVKLENDSDNTLKKIGSYDISSLQNLDDKTKDKSKKANAMLREKIDLLSEEIDTLNEKASMYHEELIKKDIEFQKTYLVQEERYSKLQTEYQGIVIEKSIYEREIKNLQKEFQKNLESIQEQNNLLLNQYSSTIDEFERIKQIQINQMNNLETENRRLFEENSKQKLFNQESIFELTNRFEESQNQQCLDILGFQNKTKDFWDIILKQQQLLDNYENQFQNLMKKPFLIVSEIYVSENYSDISIDISSINDFQVFCTEKASNEASSFRSFEQIEEGHHSDAFEQVLMEIFECFDNVPSYFSSPEIFQFLHSIIRMMPKSDLLVINYIVSLLKFIKNDRIECKEMIKPYIEMFPDATTFHEFIDSTFTFISYLLPGLFRAINISNCRFGCDNEAMPLPQAFLCFINDVTKLLDEIDNNLLPLIPTNDEYLLIPSKISEYIQSIIDQPGRISSEIMISSMETTENNQSTFELVNLQEKLNKIKQCYLRSKERIKELKQLNLKLETDIQLLKSSNSSRNEMILDLTKKNNKSIKEKQSLEKRLKTQLTAFDNQVTLLLEKEKTLHDESKRALESSMTQQQQVLESRVLFLTKKLESYKRQHQDTKVFTIGSGIGDVNIPYSDILSSFETDIASILNKVYKNAKWNQKRLLISLETLVTRLIFLETLVKK